MSDKSLDYREAAIELVRRTTAAQGLPEKITDPVVLSQIAQILKSAEPVKQVPRSVAKVAAVIEETKP